MPSELVSCPECRRTLRAPDELIGKMVKCPSCGETFTANLAARTPSPPPDTEVRPARTGRVSRDGDDDEDDRPRRRRARSRRDDDEEDDARPRRRRDLVPHRGGAVMTLGILALVLTAVHIVPFVGLVLGIVAWAMGNSDLAEIRAGRMDPEGEGQTSGGRVCGLIAVLMNVLAYLAVVLFFSCLCAGAGGRRF
jgi:hypothetical protein